MNLGLLGRKVGMTQIYDASGDAIPVTVIQAGPCHVLQLKTLERDGYEAVQLGYLDKPRRLASRADRGHVAKLDSKRQKTRATAGAAPLAKANCEPKRFVREFRVPIAEVTAELAELKAELKVGEQVTVGIFEGVRAVDVVGTTKGRGTAGLIKRHHYRGQRASHGVKKVHRHAGSIGCNSYPSRVFKGRKMAGHLGDDRRTIRNIRLVRIDSENNLLLVNGAVPGPNGGYVIIRQTNKLPVPQVK